MCVCVCKCVLVYVSVCVYAYIWRHVLIKDTALFSQPCELNWINIQCLRASNYKVKSYAPADILASTRISMTYKKSAHIRIRIRTYRPSCRYVRACVYTAYPLLHLLEKSNIRTEDHFVILKQNIKAYRKFVRWK